MIPESPTQPSSAAEALETIRRLLLLAARWFAIEYDSEPPPSLIERTNLDGMKKAMREALALLPTLSAALAKEPVDMEGCSNVIAALYTNWETFTAQRPSPRETAKAVLDYIGVPYTEAALAGGEKG